jgi:hypothetical protein
VFLRFGQHTGRSFRADRSSGGGRNAANQFGSWRPVVAWQIRRAHKSTIGVSTSLQRVLSSQNSRHVARLSLTVHSNTTDTLLPVIVVLLIMIVPVPNDHVSVAFATLLRLPLPESSWKTMQVYTSPQISQATWELGNLLRKHRRPPLNNR